MKQHIETIIMYSGIGSGILEFIYEVPWNGIVTFVLLLGSGAVMIKKYQNEVTKGKIQQLQLDKELLEQKKRKGATIIDNAINKSS